MRFGINSKFYRFGQACCIDRGFTLMELLVVISVLSVLMAILLPVLGKVKLRAKVVAVNAEIYGIGVALEGYSMENDGEFPPTRADCNTDARMHAYALPQELVDSGYLPMGEDGRIRFAEIEDRFNPGCAYKYIAPGPVYDYHGTPFGNQRLFVPEGFPEKEGSELVVYTEQSKSPVSWVVFSIGPGYDISSLMKRSFPIHKGFPVCKEYWYDSKKGSGIITRIRQRKGDHIGSFERD